MKRFWIFSAVVAAALLLPAGLAQADPPYRHYGQQRHDHHRRPGVSVWVAPPAYYRYSRPPVVYYAPADPSYVNYGYASSPYAGHYHPPRPVVQFRLGW